MRLSIERSAFKAWPGHFAVFLSRPTPYSLSTSPPRRMNEYLQAIREQTTSSHHFLAKFTVQGKKNQRKGKNDVSLKFPINPLIINPLTPKSD